MAPRGLLQNISLTGKDCFLKTLMPYLKKSSYSSTNRSKNYLKCHLIFVCKYRKKLLVGSMDHDMKNIMTFISAKSDFTIEVFETGADHIHFLIRFCPPAHYNFYCSQIKAGKHLRNMEKIQENSVKGFLERTHFLVRWLFRLFHRRGIAGNYSKLHTFARLKVPYIPKT
jgi:REP element-mobilizing transposase RayT